MKLDDMKTFLEDMGIYGEIIEDKLCFCVSFKNKENEDKHSNIYGSFYIADVDNVKILTSTAVVSKLKKIKNSDYKTLLMMQDDLLGYYSLAHNFVIYQYDYVYVDKFDMDNVLNFILYDMMSARESMQSEFGKNAVYEIEGHIDVDTKDKSIKSKIIAKGNNTLH